MLFRYVTLVRQESLNLQLAHAVLRVRAKHPRCAATCGATSAAIKRGREAAGHLVTPREKSATAACGVQVQ
eukprot:4484084-Pyramimonas_sp.AAC.1